VSALIPAEGISLLGAVLVRVGHGFGGGTRGDTIVVKPPPGHGLRVQGGRQAEGQKTKVSKEAGGTAIQSERDFHPKTMRPHDFLGMAKNKAFMSILFPSA
jgi:hypothetical protein